MIGSRALDLHEQTTLIYEFYVDWYTIIKENYLKDMKALKASSTSCDV